MTRHTTRPTPDESTVPSRDDTPSDARTHSTDTVSARTDAEAPPSRRSVAEVRSR